MNGTFITYIYLLLIIAFLVMVAQKLKISHPIVLVLGGLVLSLSGVLPQVTIEPDVIFVIFLPPILYEAAWQTTWKDFWKWRRIIFSYAFFIVLVTSCLVAFVSTQLIPGFTLALGFLLGGIVSPPDAVSATSIMRHADVPKRFSAIIEGESLLNDASSIIVFRFAIAAVTTGSFVFKDAAISFVSVIVMGALIGVAVALIFYAIHRWLPTTPNVDLVLTFVAPYLMYIAAERFHFSGVLAVVTGGLLLSKQRQTMLSPMSRIQGVNVWAVISFALNGLIFMLIGLQLPIVVGHIGSAHLLIALQYGLIIAFTLIVSRVLIALATSVFTTFISRFITTADPRPGYKGALVLGWSGMRGVVSLAAALSIPLVINNNQPFPQRNLILFITFVVILTTLVLQGLSLPYLIKKLKLKDPDYNSPQVEQEVMLQKQLTEFALKEIELKYKQELETNEPLQALHQRLQKRLELLQHIDRKKTEHLSENSEIRRYEIIHADIVDEQRKLLHDLNKKDGISEDVVKKYLLALDHEEERVKQQVKLF